VTGPERGEPHLTGGVRRQPGSRVPLPAGVTGDYEVYVNGVRQELGTDFNVVEGDLVFGRSLVTSRLGAWAWFLGIWGIGTYGRDEIDVRYDRRGESFVAHGLKVREPAAPPR
ncbi:MAG: hypothetical protein ACRDL5_03905, partial [Solirubrobacteraceae bacterium]